MGDHGENPDPTTAVGPHAALEAPAVPGGRRWLRWGRMLVDIEPPPGPNPWTSPGRAAGALDPPPPPAPVVAAPSSGWRRQVLLFVAAAVAAAIVAALLVLAFGRPGKRATFAPLPATTTTVPRPRPTVTLPASPPATSC